MNVNMPRIQSKLRIAIPPINFVVYIIIPQVVLIVVYYSCAKIMHTGDKPLDSQSIIALVCAVGGAIGGLVYFLTGSIKNTVDAAIKDILESLEELTKDISSLRVTMAERNAAMTYIEREIDSIKKSCRRCQQSREKDS